MRFSELKLEQSRKAGTLGYPRSKELYAQRCWIKRKSSYIKELWWCKNINIYGSGQKCGFRRKQEPDTGLASDIETSSWDFSGGPVPLDPALPLQGIRVWSLVRELRSHMLHDAAPPQKRERNKHDLIGIKSQGRILSWRVSWSCSVCLFGRSDMRLCGTWIWGDKCEDSEVC